MSDNAFYRTRINFYTNIACLFINIIIGIYYTPYLIKNLGLSAYGILPIVLIINQYINILTQTITHSYTRFFSIDIQRGDYQNASKDIVSSAIVVLIIILSIIPIAILIHSNIEILFNIPHQYVESARTLFIYSICSFVISLFSSLLNVQLYALNRLDLINSLKLFRSIATLILTIFVFELIGVDLSYVGIIGFIIEFFVLFFSIVLFFLKKNDQLVISIKYIDHAKIKLISVMSLWIFLHIIGDSLLYRTDIIIINHFWGTVSSGALGAINQICGYIQTASIAICSIYGPLILKSYSKGFHDQVKYYFTHQSVIIGCITSIMAGAIAGHSYIVLNIWLGEELNSFNSLLIIKMISLPCIAASGIFSLVLRTWNRVKKPAIITLMIGIINVAISYIICILFEGTDITFMLTINGLLIIIQAYFMNSIIINSIYTGTIRYLYISLVKIFVSFLITYIISYIISCFAIPETITILGLELILTAIMSFSLCLIFVLNKSERYEIIKLIK